MDDLITYRARIGMFSMIRALKSFKVKQNSGKRQVTIRRKKSTCERMPNNTVPTKSTANVGHISFYILFILCLIISGLDTCPIIHQRLLPDMTGWTSSSVCKVPCYISFVPQPGMATYVVFNCSCDPLLGNAGIHSYNGNPRTHSCSQASADQGLHNLLSIPELHFEMVDQLDSSFKLINTSLWNKFKFALKWKTRLPGDLLDKAEDMFFVSNLLEEQGEISPGSYTKLKECLVGNNECLDIINKFEYKMSRTASYCDQGLAEQRPTSNQVVGNSAEGNERFPSPCDKSNSTVPTREEIPISIPHEGLVTSSLSRETINTAFPHEGQTGGPLTTSLPNEGQRITCFPIEGPAATFDPTEEPMLASYPVKRPISSTVPEEGILAAFVSKEGLVANIDPTEGQTTNTVSTEGQIDTSVLTERHITPSISHEPMDTSVSNEEKMTTTIPTEEPMATSFLKGGPMTTTVSTKGQKNTSVPTELPITSSIPNRGHMPTAVPPEGPMITADSNEGQKTTGVPTERPVATSVPIEEQITSNLSSEGQMAITVPAGGLMATAVPSEGNQLPLTVDLHQTFQQTDIQQTQFTRLEPRIKVQHAQNVFTGNNNVVCYGADAGDQNDQANNIQQKLEGIEQRLQERKVQESNYQDTLKSTQHKFTEIIYDQTNSIQHAMQNIEEIEREFRNTTIKQTALLEQLGCGKPCLKIIECNILRYCISNTEYALLRGPFVCHSTLRLPYTYSYVTVIIIIICSI
ncbi:uncharacterized protein LOC110460411 isoform X2 [Mizuhopecten yessoensis]|uniref:uncharacterized protein LOC110460411 isoform X2 n=1 Tax=Mizuhopecten yessoensis TaxID=6573 RepID=UPI000B45CE37|nr:uncharacterized protein LOC110460411 isoform X2 [Mizuhopecten yessoensis]